MEKFKGTKGPWVLKDSVSGKSNYNIIGTALGGKYKIARVPFVSEYDKDETLYNATLIASAPELLEALQKVLDNFSKYMNSGDEEVYWSGVSSVNKALGNNET